VTDDWSAEARLLPSGRLDRSKDAARIRRTAGLPAPPTRLELPDNNWWFLYQLIERSVLRYLRALSALPPGSPTKTQLTALRAAALAQLDTVATLCRQGWSTRPMGARQTRVHRRRHRNREQTRKRIEHELMGVATSMEDFGDAAAAIAFDHALDALSDADGQRRAVAVEDSLRGIAAALDDLTALSREKLDP
jgi:hypothetical protein